MVQVNTSSSVRFKVIRRKDKDHGRSQAVEVTERNVEAIRKLWKKPEAEIGDYLTKTGLFPREVYTILKPEVFHKRWEFIYLLSRQQPPALNREALVPSGYGGNSRGPRRLNPK